MADRQGILDRLLRGNPGVPLAAGQLPPRKVAWLNPLQLLRTGYHVWLVTAATGILDRRETMAALDRRPVKPEDPFPSVLIPGKNTDAVLADPVQHAEHGMWVDFLADVGDSWEATYAVASLLVDPDLRGKFPKSARQDIPPKFGPAHVVVLGGDLVYPMGSRDGYLRRFQAPFAAALPAPKTTPPTPATTGPPAPAMFAIPGNHNWYDGLTNFFRLLCQGGALGGWRLFAAVLPAPKTTPPTPATTGPPAPAMFAIPGNHDWYDGLTNFFRLLCQGGALGGWRLFQRRSYFAVKLTEGWWLWGIDIALDTRIDSPQQDYFLKILNQSEPENWDLGERFEKKTNRVILCTAKPAWVEISRYSDEAYRNLGYFVEKLVKEHHVSVPVILTGDLHHYSRYASESGDQMIVSGGGGSYLMGTHFLPDRIPKLAPLPTLEVDRDPSLGLKSKHGREPGSEFVASAFPYPSRADSRRLALGSLWLARRPANWLFCLLIGAVYWFLARGVRLSHLPPSLPGRSFMGFLHLPQWLWRHPETINSVLAIVVICACALFAIFVNVRASRFLTAIWGTIHGLMHLWLAVSLVWLLAPHSPGVRGALDAIYLTNAAAYLLPGLFALLAGVAGGSLFGIYLAISDRYFDLHHNDAFAVQSLIDYRNFLRLHIRPDGGLDIFPVGLRRVPRRWRRRVDANDTDPLYEPADEELAPHLIEGPIRIPAPPSHSA